MVDDLTIRLGPRRTYLDIGVRKIGDNEGRITRVTVHVKRRHVVKADIGRGTTTQGPRTGIDGLRWVGRDWLRPVLRSGRAATRDAPWPRLGRVRTQHWYGHCQQRNGANRESFNL